MTCKLAFINLEGQNAKTEENFIRSLETLFIKKIDNIEIKYFKCNPIKNETKFNNRLDKTLNRWKPKKNTKNLKWYFFIIIDLDKKEQQRNNKKIIETVKKIIEKSFEKHEPKTEIHFLCKERKNIEDLLIYPLADCKGKNKKKDLNEKIAAKKHKANEYDHKIDPDLLAKITNFKQIKNIEEVLENCKKKLQGSEYKCVFSLLLECYSKSNKK